MKCFRLVIVLLLATSYLFTCCGCSVTNSYHYKVTSGEGFSDGLAWIRFEDDFGKQYTGAVDTAGNVKFFYEGSFLTEPFINGESFIREEGLYEQGKLLYRVDSTGKIINSYSVTPNTVRTINGEYSYPGDGVRVWGEGYVLEQIYTSGFNEAKFNYKLLDPSGSILDSFESTGTMPINEMYDMGNGVFCYQDNGANFYFSRSNTWIKNQVANMLFGNTFKDGILVYFCGTYSGNTFFTYTDAYGNYKDVMIPEEYGEDPVVKETSDGIILFQNEEEPKSFYIYDTNTEQFSMYNGRYADRIYWNSAVNDHQLCAFGDGVMALPFVGQDNNNYIGLIDVSGMDMVGEPFPMLENSFIFMNMKISDGVLIVSSGLDGLAGVNDHVRLYDLTGKTLYDFYDNSSKLNGFSNGIMVSTTNETPKYMHYDGAPVFTEFNFSKALKVSP